MGSVSGSRGMPSRVHDDPCARHASWAGPPLAGVTRIGADPVALTDALPAVAPDGSPGAGPTLGARPAMPPRARGRAKNQVVRAHPLAPSMRVDPTFERRVVEIDGPNRGALTDADDRRRDNALVVAGYAVSRFTNDDIRDDVARVLHVIEVLLASRQKGDTP